MERTQNAPGSEEAESDEIGKFALSGGHFYVNVVSCQFFPDPPKEYSGAYCVLSLGRQQVRTDNARVSVAPCKAVHGDQVQFSALAEWLFSATFDVMAGHQSREFSISVWTTIAGEEQSALELIGTATLDLKTIPPGEFQERNISLQLPNGSSARMSPVLRTQIQLTRHQSHVTEDDFEKLRLIGRGSFGKVFQVRKKDTERVYAMKVLSKGHVIRSNAVKHTMAENRVLKSMNHPFIVNLNYAFQTPTHLYMVIDYFNGGELFHHLTQEDYFSEERAKFYAAEVVSALTYLHSRQVIYRDLKPENILLDMDGNICLVDFGLCKEGIGLNGRTHTFCGSPEYLAPELLLGKGYGKEVDWWALGTLIYEMLSGLPPFWDDEEETMHRKILSAPLKLPQYMSAPVKDLLKGLLTRNPADRLGSGLSGSERVKQHPWFRSIDWTKLERKELMPPFRPHITGLMDLRYFDQALTQEHPDLSVSSSTRSDIDQNVFVGFSYDVDHDPVASLMQRVRPGTSLASPQSARRRNRRRASNGSGDSGSPSSEGFLKHVADGHVTSNTAHSAAADGDIFPLE